MSRIGYFIRRALRNMRQSLFLCGTAVATIAVALTVMAFFGIVVTNLQNLTRHWSNEIQVVIYLENPPAEQLRRQWQTELLQLPQVEAIQFVDPGEAFRRFQQRLGQDADLLEGVPVDILPASLELILKEPFRNRRGVTAVVERLRGYPQFADLHYGQDWLERFDALVTLLRLGGLVLGGFLLFATLFIVANTIRLTLYARRDEIEIMALVGATPLFIKFPFVVEGVLQGSIGGALAVACSYLFYYGGLQQGMAGLLLTTGMDQVQFLSLQQQGWLLVAGAALGLGGSLTALRKLVRL